jgi:hypothetical protein
MWPRMTKPETIILDASLRPRLQQKSQPRNARREISVVACAEIPRALRLCRKLDSRARQEQAQNGGSSDIGWRRPAWLAGAGGLEPPNGGIKIQLISFISQRPF